MSPLVKIRAGRDQMSAVERRIADFVLENAQLLRDYSSQQLADALGISQSSVVKFTQKLGFKGYPDLKYSVGEAIARADGGNAAHTAAQAPGEENEARADALWRGKSEAAEETRLLNAPETVRATAEMLATARRVFVTGAGEDGVHAHAFASRLAWLGIATVHHFDLAHMAASVAAADLGDALLVFCEHGNHPALCRIGRRFRERQGRIVSLTRHTSNPLRALADVALSVCAHDERAHIRPLLYQSALQHLLDGVFVRLCESDERRQVVLRANSEIFQHMLEL